MSRRLRSFGPKGINRLATVKKRSMQMETLEDRHLLAADLLSSIYEAESISHPFAADAVTVEQMIARSQSHSYIEGELVVATTLPTIGDATEQLINNRDWNQFLGVDAVPIKTLMNFEQSPGSSFALVHMDLGDGDVIEAMREIEGAEGVLWTAPNFYFDGENATELTPNDPQYGQQYHHTLMQNDLAWDTTLGDSSIVIGVTDSGVDLDHVDLDDSIWVNTGEIAGNGIDDDLNGYVDDVNGYDFAHNNNDPNPQSNSHSHGTHVAGIASADTNNGVGVAGTAGGTTIMPLQFYDQSNGSLWTSTVINDTYSYAADNGAHIVVTSYNVNGWVGDPTFTAGLQYMYDGGVLHFNSAGNGGELNPIRTTFEQTLFVVSTDSLDRKAGSSNWGVGVDISAPGASIRSTIPGNSYQNLSGTSMAAPNAAGVAGLVWSANPNWTREMVAAQVLATADNIDAQNPSFAGLMGTGRVNSFNALNATLDAPQVKSLIGLPENGGSVSASTPITGLTVRFDQLMEPATINDTANFELRSAGADGLFDTSDDTFVGIALPDDYQISTNDFDVDFIGGQLGIGNYRFSFLSGGMTNPFGTGLDGNANGVGGDNYERFFSIGLESFERVEPLGSLAMVSRANPGTLSDVSDSNQFTFFAEAGELLTAVVTPNTSVPTMTVEILGVTGPTSGSPGDSVILPVGAATSTGQQTIQITADMAASYQFSVYRNVNIDALVESTGTVAIDDSYIELESGRNGTGRYGAAGQSNGSTGGVQFNQYNNSGLFVDISGTGTPLGLGDDGEATVTTTVGNAFFPAGLNTIGNNGVVASGAGVNIDYNNTLLPNSAFDKALFPFWDDIDSDSGNVFWEERLVNGINTFIVQWNDRPHFSNTGDATFQVQVFQSGPVAVRYAYQDVIFGDANDHGAGATIGIQFDSSNAAQYSLNQAVVNDGDVIDMMETDPNIDTDRFSIDLSAHVGRRVDVILATQNGSLANGDLELFDAGGMSVAVGSATPLGQSVSNYDVGILDYLVTSGGVYEIAVSSNQTVQYGLYLTEYLLDTEDNDSPSNPLRSLDDVNGALGGIDDSQDIYEITLAQGESLTLATQTPLDDPGRYPLNSLDPNLTVRDSGGTIVASDDNSGTDGKNAQLTFVAGAAGIYRIYVAGSGNGEYLLGVNPNTTLPDGDFDDNGIWECADIDALVGQIAAGTNLSAFDLTGDGLVNLEDRDAWLAEAGGINLGPGRVYLLGDANLDGFVDGIDFIQWNTNRFQPIAEWCSGDFDANGVVDGLDFIEWNNNRFQSSFNVSSDVTSTIALSAAKLDVVGENNMSPIGEVSTANSVVDLPPAKYVAAAESRFADRERARRRATDRVFAENEPVFAVDSADKLHVALPAIRQLRG
jgi:subtilisin family serine protease